MLIELTITILTFICMTFLGLMVLFRNPNSWTNRFFFLLTVTIDLYLITNYISLHPPDNSPSTQLFWIRIVMSQGSFLGPALFLLVHTFPKDKIKIKSYQLLAVLGLATTSAILSLSPFLFTSIQYPQGRPTPIPGPAMPVFILDFAGLFMLSFILLIIKYKKAKGVEKIQERYFLAGVIGTFTLMVISTVFLVIIFKSSNFVFLGPVSSLILIIAVAYTIVRHRFLDVRLIVARAVVYLLFILLIGGFYSIAFFIFGSYLFGIPFTLNQIFFYGFTTLIVVFSFSTFRRIIEQMTRSIFYKGYYEPQNLIKSVSQITSSTIELNNLTSNALKEILSQMKVTRGAFILFSREKKEVSYVEQLEQEQKFHFSQEDIDFFMKENKIIIFEEIEEGKLKEIMRNIGVSFAIPLKSSDIEIGLFLLGEKASGEVFTKQDIDTLEILAPHLSIAMQNSMEYEEIKKFNITLKEEVEKATRELQDANNKLKDLDKLKDEFVSLASHELRTPMTIIKSYVWMLLNSKTEKVTEHQKHYLNTTYASVERLIHLVNDMLNISRIESGKVVINKSPIDIGDLIATQVSQLQSRGNELGVKINYQKLDQPLTVLADPDKISQVLINLLGNSFKFTPRDGTIKVSIEKTNDGYAEISITDTGRGMSAADLSKLFQRFTMVGDTHLTKEKGQGTGLGLYLSKSLVELQGGKIWAQSKGINMGSTFSFTLPLATSQGHTSLPPEPSPQG